MNTTINDVAKACGVSCATVSRVLTGKGNVKEETSALVLKCAAELQYQGRSAPVAVPEYLKIMLIVGDIRNQFYLGIIEGVSERLHENNYKLAIFHSNNIPGMEEEYVRFAHKEKYQGIIMITAMETQALIRLLRENACPVVLVNRFIRSMDLNAVCIDNFRGGYMATHYLIEKGHKRIAHLAGPENSTASQDRLRGYMNALKDFALTVEKKAVFQGDLKAESGAAFADYYLSRLREYTAVFCANDIMAAALIEKLAQSGLRVPGDLSVICFDDTPVATQGPVKLTTVSKDPVTMGEVTAEIMMDMLHSKKPVTRKVVFPPVLNERDSVLVPKG